MHIITLTTDFGARDWFVGTMKGVVLGINGMLAAEFVAAEPPVTQPAPHQILRPGFGPAKLAGAFDVGHDGNLGNEDEMEKMVFTPALILAFSPWEKE